MRLIYLRWGYLYDKDIQKAFGEKGVDICPFDLSVRAGIFLYPPVGGEEAGRLQALLEEKKPDAVFSVNFLAGISDFCEKNNVRYYAWVLQLPCMDLFTASVRNGCNRIGVCDSYLTERLWRQNAGNISFLPEAVAECRRVKCDTIRPCSYVGKVPAAYPDTPFGTNSRGLSENTMGYLAGMAHCQRVLYGATVLEDILMGSAAAELAAKYPVPGAVLEPFGRLYLAEAYIAPEVTRLEQIILLQNMSTGVDLDVFTDGEFPDCLGRVSPYKEDLQERLEVYGSTIVNIVQAPRELHDAIPHQTLEIMASGNFVLTNYQKDYGYFFKQDETIACYGDRLERAELFNKYGMDPKARVALCDAAFEVVREGHTYAHRVGYMLKNWG